MSATDTAGGEALIRARALLAPGERLLWAERPHAWHVVRRQLPQGLAGVVVLGFATYWTIGTMAVLPLGALPGLLFMAVGGWVATRPYAHYHAARRTLYALTDKRAIIVDEGPQPDIRSFAPSDIGSVRHGAGKDGIGFVQFAATGGPFGFAAIADAARVAAAVERLRAGRLESPAPADE